MSRCNLCPPDGTIRLGEGVSVVWGASEGTHRVLWTTPAGQRRQKRARDHRRAVAVAHDARDQLMTAPVASLSVHPPSRASSTMTVAELCEAHVEAAASEGGHSLGYKEKQLGLICNHIRVGPQVPVSTWETADTLVVLDRAARTLGPSSRAQLLSLLRQAAKHGRQRGVLVGDPTVGVQVTTPKRHKPTAVVPDGEDTDRVRFVEVDERPTSEAVERLAAALDADGWAGDAARLAAYCGARWGELWALEGNDLVLDTMEVHIDRRVDSRNYSRNGTILTPDGRRPRYWMTAHGPVALPKGDKTRVTMLPPWLTHLADVNGVLFPSRRGGYRKETGTSWNSGPFHRARVAAGWPRRPDGRWVWTWHSLRHHAASWMLEQGIPIADVSEMLGHAQVSTTLRMYVHPTGGAAGRAAARVSGWSPPAV